MISALLSTIIITLAIAGNANAQNQDKNVAFITKTSYTDESASVTVKESKTATTANTKGGKALLKIFSLNGQELIGSKRKPL